MKLHPYHKTDCYPQVALTSQPYFLNERRQVGAYLTLCLPFLHTGFATEHTAVAIGTTAANSAAASLPIALGCSWLLFPLACLE